jgi:HAD superfamily hydrolase (TIGR01490 family)
MQILDPLNKDKVFVIFDFDKTISKHDSYISFLMLALRSRPWRIFFSLHLPFMALFYVFGFLNNSSLKQIFLKAILRGAQRTAVSDLCDLFVSKLLTSGLHADALRTIKRHQDQGHFLILATASFDFYIEPVAKKLGFEQTICTKSEWIGDRLSGRISGKNCHGEIKRDVVALFLSEKNIAKYIIAYTDHYSDLPILLLSDEGYLVNPDRLTRSKLVSYNFHIVTWR